MDNTPTLKRIRQVAERLSPYLLRTPTVPWPGEPALADTRLDVKLELLQHGGSFKPRGALNTLLECHERDPAALDRGAVAFSAGNHAIATAWAGRALGVPVTVVMPRSANTMRVERCRELGATLVFGRDVAELMSLVNRIREDEGRLLVHPFEGVSTIEGTACVGLELADDRTDLDAVIVPVGGGGLIAGMAAALRQRLPDVTVHGVEPEGACGMRDSLRAGRPSSLVEVDTIADSLGAPFHLPISYSLVEHHVASVVTVSDAALRDSMCRLADAMKLMVEPACAASLAALVGPLADTLRGRRVAIVACGSNIDRASWWRLLDGA